MKIDDIAETFEFDCKFRMIWFDNRFNISQLFPYLGNATRENGIEISQMYDSQSQPLVIWRPDVHFVDAQNVDMIAESFRIKEHGVLYYSRHLSLTLSQSSFNYRNYPLDKQTAEFRFESYSYPINLMNLNFVNPPVQFYQSPKSKTQSFWLNPLWQYDSYETGVEYPNYQFTVTSPAREFASAYVTMIFTRRSSGILLRLALPIMFVAVLAGMVFWAEQEKRLDFTVTLLLTISALYVSIIAGIPLVGYATNMDSFVFCMFIILLFAVLVHILTHLMTKSSKTDEELGVEKGEDKIEEKESYRVPDRTSKRMVDVDSDDEDLSVRDSVAYDKRKSARVNRLSSSAAQESLQLEVKSVEKKRLHSRFFLTDCIVLFGRLVIPVVPLFIGFVFYSSALGSQGVVDLMAIIFALSYAALVYLAVFVYSRKRLAKKFLLAMSLVQRDTDKGRNVMMFDLMLLSIFDFFNKSKKNKQEKEKIRQKSREGLSDEGENPMSSGDERNTSNGIAMTERNAKGAMPAGASKTFMQASRARLRLVYNDAKDNAENPSAQSMGHEETESDAYHQAKHYQESDIIFKRVFHEKE